MTSIRHFITIITLTFTLVSCATYKASSSRSPKWAQPVTMDGVSNLYKVDDNLYRSAQPTPEGMKNLKLLGIKTVINLRAFNDDSDELRGTNLRQIDIPMHAWNPRNQSAHKFIAITSNKQHGPFLVHCYHGSDRTGSMVSLYRVSQDGWDSDEAIREMLYGGFGFHKIWQHLINWTKSNAKETQHNETK